MADLYVDIATGSDSTGLGTSAQPYATPGKANGAAIAAATAGYRVIVKTGNYPVTSGTDNVSGGVLNFSLTGSTTATNRMVGVTDFATLAPARFTLTLAAGLSPTVVTFNNANSYNALQNVEIVGNATANGSAVNGNGRSNRLINLYARAFTGGNQHIVQVGSNFSLRWFRIAGGATSNYASISVSGSCDLADGIVDGNAGRGVEWAASTMGVFRRIVSANHTGSNGYGFTLNAFNEAAGDGLVAYGNAQSGFHPFNSQYTLGLTDSVAWGNGGYGANFASADALCCYGCAFGGNASGNFAATPAINDGFVSLASNPFAGAASLDFTPGASLKTLARLWPFLRSTGYSTTYPDAGAVQAAGGGSSGVTAREMYYRELAGVTE